MVSPAAVSILMYHQIGCFAPMRRHRANYCDQYRFADQLRWLRWLNYTVLDLDTAIAGLRGVISLPARAVVVTIDDGYRDFMTTAAPVLLDYGWSATLYVISDWLGQRMQWRVADDHRPQPLLLNAAELRQLHQLGFTIGSHTCQHRQLAELSPADQRQELTASKAALEDCLGAAVNHLCYPFGSFNATTIALAAAAGYHTATTCLRGAATAADHPLLLPRKAISFGDNLIGYHWKVRYKHAPTPALQQWRLYAHQQLTAPVSFPPESV